MFNPHAQVCELSSGLVLAKHFVPDELAIRLAECCLFDFPQREDAKTNVAKLGKDVEKCIKSFRANSTLAKADLFGLRWTTLGYHHNWDTREYSDSRRDIGKMPELLERVGTAVSKCFAFSFLAEAAICNYYPANVGTIGIHRDDSEYCSHPIVSISLGLPAVFLVGKGERDDPCHELLLEHGDLLIMDGADRQALHAVPRVLDFETAHALSDYSIEKLRASTHCIRYRDCDTVLNYLRQARININLRQVST